MSELGDDARRRADKLVDLVRGEGLELRPGEEESNANGVSALQQRDHAVALPTWTLGNGDVQRRWGGRPCRYARLVDR